MGHITIIKTALILFSLVFFKFDAEALELHSPIEMSQDSLVLKKQDSDRQIVILAGDKIKLWLLNSNSEVGELKSINQDTLILLNNGTEKLVLMNDIVKIKIYSGSLGRVIGGLFTAVGVGGMVFGGISLVAGVIALLAENLGAIILVAVPVLAGGGFGIFKAGERLGGRKISLKSKWSIEMNQSK